MRIKTVSAITGCGCEIGASQTLIISSICQYTHLNHLSRPHSSCSLSCALAPLVSPSFVSHALMTRTCITILKPCPSQSAHSVPVATPDCHADSASPHAQPKVGMAATDHATHIEQSTNPDHRNTAARLHPRILPALLPRLHGAAFQRAGTYGPT